MTPVSKLESRGEKLRVLVSQVNCNKSCLSDTKHVSHESRTNSTRAHPQTWDTGRSAVSKVPLAFLWARLCAARRCWILLVSAARVLWAFKTSCATIEMTPQKREHMQPWVAEAYSHIVYNSFYWFVWCVIFSSNTQPMTCPLQVLMKANPTKATSTATSISVSKPAPWTHIPSRPFPQDHTFCGSTISYSGWFRNCHSQDVYTYSHILYQLQQDLKILQYVLWKRPTHSGALQKKTTNLWMDNPLLFCCQQDLKFLHVLPECPSLQVSKYQGYLV